MMDSDMKGKLSYVSYHLIKGCFWLVLYCVIRYSSG